jgi:hypothetical protein
MNLIKSFYRLGDKWELDLKNVDKTFMISLLKKKIPSVVEIILIDPSILD